MDALKYSGYMGSLYSSASSDQAAIKSMYSSPDTQPQPSAASGAGAGQEGGVTKTEYSADSLSRSYLEQQRAYYESAGLKAGGGYPGAGAGSYGGGGGGGGGGGAGGQVRGLHAGQQRPPVRGVARPQEELQPHPRPRPGAAGGSHTANITSLIMPLCQRMLCT